MTKPNPRYSKTIKCRLHCLHIYTFTDIPGYFHEMHYEHFDTTATNYEVSITYEVILIPVFDLMCMITMCAS